MPQQIKFAYVPSNEVRIHEVSIATRPGSPDFAGPTVSRRDMLGLSDHDHVLMLEFPDAWSSQATAPGYCLLPASDRCVIHISEATIGSFSKPCCYEKADREEKCNLLPSSR